MSLLSMHWKKAASEVAKSADFATLVEHELEVLAGSRSKARTKVLAAITKRGSELINAGLSPGAREEAVNRLSSENGSGLRSLLAAAAPSPTPEAPAEADASAPGGDARPIFGPAKPSTSKPRPRRVVGRLVRVRGPDGSFAVTGIAELRRRHGKDD